jgi:hypothetical protein
MLVERMKDELDVLAGLLLEGSDDLPGRLVLLGVEPLVPPHDEVGAPRAKRRHREHRGENRSSAAHVSPSRSAAPQYRLAAGALQRSRETDLDGSRSVGFGKVGFGSRPAYRREPVAGPLCGLQRSKHARMSGLSRISVVLRPSP